MSNLKKRSLAKRRLYWSARQKRRHVEHPKLWFKTRHPAPPAFSALRAWRDGLNLVALDALNAAHDSCPPGLDLTAPLWVMIATGFPSDLDTEDRASCEMIMGLAPLGAPRPDWALTLSRVKEIFNSNAQAQGSDASVTLLELSSTHDDSFCEGRAISFMPGFSYSRGEGWWIPSSQLIDPRRARRRSGRPLPAFWYERFGALSQTLWSSGLSLSRLDAELRGMIQTWSLTAHCVAQALQESGCTWTARIPGFFASWPAALDDLDLMRSIDRDSLDPLRTLWALEQSSNGSLKALEPSRRRSL